MRKDRTGRDLGAVTLDPDAPCVIVGRRCFFSVIYKVGPGGVETGGVLRFKLPGLIVYEGGPDPVTCSNPNVRWTCSNRIPKVNGKNGRSHDVSRRDDAIKKHGTKWHVGQIGAQADQQVPGKAADGSRLTQQERTGPHQCGPQGHEDEHHDQRATIVANQA